MLRRWIFYFVTLSVGIITMSCGESKKTEKPLELADMDLSVDPGDDFYRYANGGWLDRTEIPEDRVSYGAFDILQEQTEEKVRDILFRAMQRSGDSLDAEWVKIGDFFASGLDTASIERAGLSPIQPDLEQIEAIMAPPDLVKEFARERAIGGSNPFYVSVEQDRKDATSLLFAFYQSGLGMPDRDYYFEDSERAEALREAYRTMLERIFTLLGKDEQSVESIASDVFILESKLAEASLTNLEYRDPLLTYNKLSLEQLKALSPNIDWTLYFKHLNIEAPRQVLVDNPQFLTVVSNLLLETEINVWKDYLAAHYVLAYASNLTQELEGISFEFYGKALSGQEVQQPRWKRVMRVCQAGLGEAIGKVYVKENFPPAAKQRMLELVQNLRDAYRQRIARLAWMSDATKAKAQEKLDAIVVKIGYPDHWKDYTDLQISRDSYAINVRNARIFRFHQTMEKLHKPLDRAEWFMTPQTVNAYYNPSMNEIVFPAAILQPPFFNMEADDAVNYGAIGVVIAHEITHGFDDQGRKYNKDGNLENWWTSEDSARFVTYSQLLVDQFDAFEAIDGMHVNGKLTLGENIADYGGMTIAVHALRRVLDKQAKEGQEVPPIDGFSPMQRFFLSYAKLWRNKMREQELIRRLKDDVHSPGKYRVLGGVYNIDEFYSAFTVKTSSPYYRTHEKRPSIW